MDPYFLGYMSRFRCGRGRCTTFHSFPAIYKHRKSHGSALHPGGYSASLSTYWEVTASDFFDDLGITPNEWTDDELEAMGAGYACKGCSTIPPSTWFMTPVPGVPVAGLKWSQLVQHAFSRHF